MDYIQASNSEINPLDRQAYCGGESSINFPEHLLLLQVRGLCSEIPIVYILEESWLKKRLSYLALGCTCHGCQPELAERERERERERASNLTCREWIWCNKPKAKPLNNKEYTFGEQSRLKTKKRDTITERAMVAKSAIPWSVCNQLCNVLLPITWLV